MRLMLIGAVLAIAGCTSAGGPRGGPGGPPAADLSLHCTPSGNCNVVVRKDCVMGFMACKPAVSHDPVIVTGGGNTILWVLAGAHLRWQGAGIVPDPQSGIQCNAPAGNTVRCSNPGRPSPTPDGWKYTVQIEGVGPLDPWIINN